MEYQIIPNAPQEYYVEVTTGERPGVTGGWAYVCGDGWLCNFAYEDAPGGVYFVSEEAAEEAVAKCALNSWRLWNRSAWIAQHIPTKGG